MTNSVSAPALDGERMLGAPLRIHASGPETAGCHSSLGRPENSGAGQVGSTNVLASLTGSGMSIPCMLSSRLTDEVFNGEAERFIQTLLREWAYAKPYAASARRNAALGERTVAAGANLFSS